MNKIVNSKSPLKLLIIVNMPALSHFHMLGNLVKFSFLRSWKLTFSPCGSMQKDNRIMGNELAEIWVGVPRPVALRIWRMKPSFFPCRKIVKSPKFKCTCSQRFFFGSSGFLLSSKNHTSKFQFEADFYEPAKTSVSHRSSPLGTFRARFLQKRERTFFDFFIKPFECFLGKLLLSPWDKLQFLSILHVIPTRSSFD